MIRELATGDWRRKLTGVLLIVSYCIGAWGFSTNSLSLMSGGAFPCAGHKCGCASATQCWKNCCCYTPVERQLWAKLNGMHLPEALVEKPTPPVPSQASSCCSMGKTRSSQLQNTAEKTSAHGSQISTSLRELRMQAARGDDGTLCSRRSSVELTPPKTAKTILVETKNTSSSSCCSVTQKGTKTEPVPVASKPACCAPSSPANPSASQLQAQKSSLSEPESAPTSSVPWLDTLKCQGAGSMWTMLTEPLTTPPIAMSWQPWSPHQSTFAPSQGIPCEVFYNRLSPPG
ncbi:hypothetical protein [Planctopirus limnophila]|nr:hypothetical protein [Planctopirus limnophila]